MIRRVLRSALAAAALIALVVGLPVALLAWGRSPLEGNGSTWDQLTALPTQTVSDTMAFGALTMAAWMGWAMFTAHVIVELAAAAGAGLRWQLPAFGPLHLGARRLVTALTMTVALSGPLGQRAGAVPTLPAATASLEYEARLFTPHPGPAPTASAGTGVISEREPSTFDNSVDDAPTADAPAPSSPQPIVTVVEGDHPWGLAERHLGDGFRWHEIWDLNRGVTQPDGRAWVTADLIHPGWRFTLPEDAVDVDDESTEQAETGEEAPASSAGASDTSTTPSDSQLPPEPEDTNDPPVSPSTTEAGDVSSERSGSSSTTEPDGPDNEPLASSEGASDAPAAPEDSVTLNDDEAPPESTMTTTTIPDRASDASPGISSDDAASSSEDADVDDTRGGGPLPVAPLLGIAGSLMAVGVARELRRRRARRSVQLPLGTVPSPPPPLPAAGEVLERADEDAADRLDTAMAHLAHSVRPRPGAGCVQPRVVQVDGRRIDVCLDRADPHAPTPWRPEASGLIWVLDDAQALSHLDDSTPLPSLVTIGVDDADVLLDLEAHGVVGLVGDPIMCQRMALSMVAELAVRGEGVATTLVGDVLGTSEIDLDGVHMASSWSDVDTSAIASSVRLLDAGQWPHTWAARASGRVFDGWAPCIWVTSPTDDPRGLSTIEAVSTRPGAGSAVVVVGGDPGCGVRIHVDAEGNFRIPDLGLSGAAQLLDTQATDQLIELLDDAESHEGTVVPLLAADDDDGGDDEHRVRPDSVLNNEEGPEPEPAIPATSPSESLHPLHDDEYQDPDYEVLVRVCGPIAVVGGRDDLPQRETSVATYIGLHGQADIDQIRNAVWGGTDVSRKRTQNVVSTVRRSVGEAITWTSTGRLAAGPGLTTDLELIERRLSYARHQEPEARIPVLRGGLDLVTGQVCTYPRSALRAWRWVELDGWIPHVEAIVGTLAVDLAKLCLQLDDGHGVIAAAQRGIEAVGRRTELAVLLARGHEQVGDESAARTVVRSHEAYLEDLGVDELDEDLLELLDRYAAPIRGKSGA